MKPGNLPVEGKVLNPAFPLQGMRDERTYITLSEGFLSYLRHVVNYCAASYIFKKFKKK